MEVIFGLMFILVFGVFIHSILSGIFEWTKNNNSPRIIVPVSVVSKRTNVSRSHHGGTGHHHHHTSTTYFVTFQLESGDRIELKMSGDEYGLIAEGDNGRLTFQGTRFLDFERQY